MAAIFLLSLNTVASAIHVELSQNSKVNNSNMVLRISCHGKSMILIRLSIENNNNSGNKKLQAPTSYAAIIRSAAEHLT